MIPTCTVKGTVRVINRCIAKMSLTQNFIYIQLNTPTKIKNFHRLQCLAIFGLHMYDNSMKKGLFHIGDYHYPRWLAWWSPGDWHGAHPVIGTALTRWLAWRSPSDYHGDHQVIGMALTRWLSLSPVIGMVITQWLAWRSPGDYHYPRWLAWWSPGD